MVSYILSERQDAPLIGAGGYRYDGFHRFGFHVIGSFISMVFEAIVAAVQFGFSVLGGLLGLVVNLGMLLLVVGLVALVITRRKNYKQAKADEPRVIHMDNGETFKSYYSK